MDANTDQLPTAFTYATARAAGLSDRRLRALVEAEVLDHFGLGVYRKAQAPIGDLDLIEIALRAPDATLCLATARQVVKTGWHLARSRLAARKRARQPPWRV